MKDWVTTLGVELNLIEELGFVQQEEVIFASEVQQDDRAERLLLE